MCSGWGAPRSLAVATSAAALVAGGTALTLATLHRFDPGSRDDLPPVWILVLAALLASLFLARHPAAFGYSPVLSVIVFVSLSATAALAADAAFGEGMREGWRATMLVVFVLVAIVLVLKRWSLLTGLPRMAVLSTGEGARDEDGRPPLRVLSWNVYLRSVASERITENDAKEARAKRLADPVVSPLLNQDIVCMQEFCATANYRVHRMMDAARAMGFTHAVCPAAPPLLSPAIVDSGLVILSRRPLSDLRSDVLQRGTGPDRFMAKRVDSVRVGSPAGSGSSFGLVHTHTQSGYTLVEVPRVESVKRAQLRQVAGHWKRAARRDGRVVLCGDLNWDGREPGRHAELMGMLTEKGGTETVDDPLLGQTPSPSQLAPERRPPTAYVTYAANGQEAHVNFYPVLEARAGEVILPRSIDYVLVGRAAAKEAAEPPFVSARARRVMPSPPRGVHAMSDHHAIQATLS